MKEGEGGRFNVVEAESIKSNFIMRCVKAIFTVVVNENYGIMSAPSYERCGLMVLVRTQCCVALIIIVAAGHCSYFQTML